MNEETEKMAEGVSEVAEAEVVTDDGDGFDSLDDNMKILIERQGTKLPEPEAVEEVAEEQVAEEVAGEPEPLFVLEDGTKVMTVEEAKKGYLRQSDYTKKRQESVAIEKDLQQYNALINRMKEDPALTKMVIDHITGNGQQAQQQQTNTNQIEVPDEYKNDPFVTRLAERTNSLSEKVSQLESGFNTIHTEKTAVQQRTELDTKVNTRMAEAYNELKGQVETPPTPQQFMERIAAHFNELGMTPEQATALITSPDPTYLSAKVERIFAEDISKVKQAKSTVVEKERTKRVATTQALRAGGKSSTVAPQSLPKGKDGKVDSKAALKQIMDAQDQLDRR